MNRLLTFAVILISLTYSSCEFQKQSSTGKSLEIILVQGDNCNDADFQLFKQYLVVPQVPILETEIYGEKKNYFKIIPIKERDFNSIFRTHKNIIFVYSSTSFSLNFKQDVWAENQNIYACTINKNDIKKSSFEDFIKDLGLTIKQNELTKRSKMFYSITPKEIKNYVQKKHNLSISMPQRFFIVDSLSGCLYLRGETKKSSQRILISDFYLEPTIENILLEQNKIAKKNISSKAKGSYLKIEDRASLYIDSISTDDNLSIIIKGLWKMESDFMGGGFMTLLIKNSSRNLSKLLTFYLYAPGENKANYLLDLEAILRSVEYFNN